MRPWDDPPPPPPPPLTERLTELLRAALFVMSIGAATFAAGLMTGASMMAAETSYAAQAGP